MQYRALYPNGSLGKTIQQNEATESEYRPVSVMIKRGDTGRPQDSPIGSVESRAAAKMFRGQELA